MQNLHVRGRLAFGALLGLAAALPLACSDSDGDDGSAGRGGTAGTAQGGKGGTAQGGKSGSAGAPQGGKGGGTANAGTGAGGSSGGVGLAGTMDQGGAPDMAGTGGAVSGAGDNGMAGDNSMAGAGGAAQTYEEMIDTLCNTISTLDCSTSLDQAGEKSDCVDRYMAQPPEGFDTCSSQYLALTACLESSPASGFHCMDNIGYANDATCSAQSGDFVTCLSPPP